MSGHSDAVAAVTELTKTVAAVRAENEALKKELAAMTSGESDSRLADLAKQIHAQKTILDQLVVDSRSHTGGADADKARVAAQTNQDAYLRMRNSDPNLGRPIQPYLTGAEEAHARAEDEKRGNGAAPESGDQAAV